ncbi:helix-turn-helix domain-containing protein [Lentzea sp. JNUCC 0626]|uniref:helix-turn-helix domain-containing protein n=1 Tax=Lentzea sp. JNUCC 0626 TaxID=3367513 RepID=UPI00374970F4
MNDEARRVGAKIAAKRVELELSQKEFGKRIKRSESWVSQVERGVRKIDRMSVLEIVAEVLEIPISELQPAAIVEAATSGKPQAVSDLALALTASSALRSTLGRPFESDRDVGTADLLDGAKRAWELAHGSSYRELGEKLLDLLPQLEIAARVATADEQTSLFAALAKAYHAAAAVLSKLGETAAAWVAADRAISRAERSGDPLLMAEGAFRLTIVFHSARWLELARSTAEDADEALMALDMADNPSVHSLRGALNLQLAVLASRSDDADRAYAHLDVAARLAEQLGEDRNDYDTEFGPTNVRLHEVSIALGLGDAGRALRVGEALDASGLSAERQVRLLIDLARAHEQRRNVSGVMVALAAAEELAPEQVRSHPLVHKLLADLSETSAANDPAFIDLKERLVD